MLANAHLKPWRYYPTVGLSTATWTNLHATSHWPNPRMNLLLADSASQEYIRKIYCLPYSIGLFFSMVDQPICLTNIAKGFNSYNIGNPSQGIIIYNYWLDYNDTANIIVRVWSLGHPRTPKIPTYLHVPIVTINIST